MIGIIDYGAGNLHSVEKSIKRLGYSNKIISEVSDFHGFDKIIFPGVGNARKTMNILSDNGLATAIQNAVSHGTPFLGICLGMQLLMLHSKENDTACLGIFEGVVEPFRHPLIVPHMGWNEVKWERNHPVFEGIPSDTHFYFVHSYYVQSANVEETIGSTVYGSPFTSVIANKQIIGVQFHPEKSGEQGLTLLDNFCSL